VVRGGGGGGKGPGGLNKRGLVEKEEKLTQPSGGEVEGFLRYSVREGSRSDSTGEGGQSKWPGGKVSGI